MQRMMKHSHSLPKTAWKRRVYDVPLLRRQRLPGCVPRGFLRSLHPGYHAAGHGWFSVAEAIRNMNQDIPVIFLSAKTLKEDRLRGLRIGADDYLVKPFNMEELVLKIEVFLPVPKTGPAVKTYRAGSYSFDPDNFLLLRGKEQIILTQKEAALLQFLLDNKTKF